MSLSQVHYLPLAPPFFFILVGLFVALFLLIQIGVLLFAMAGGRDRVNHPNRAGHHDDLANACAGAIWRATAKPEPMRISEKAMARARERPLPTSRWPSARQPRWLF